MNALIINKQRVALLDYVKSGAMAILRQNRKKRGFDPDKVLTCVTADKARVGMRGYFADDLNSLKRGFNSVHVSHKLTEIHSEVYIYRFGNKIDDYALFYPIDDEEE